MNERTIRRGGSCQGYPLLERSSRIRSMSDFCSLCDNILNGKMIQRRRSISIARGDAHFWIKESTDRVNLSILKSVKDSTDHIKYGYSK